MFGVFAPTETMFYADVTTVGSRLDARQYDLARERGFRVAVYGTPDDVPVELRERGADIVLLRPWPDSAPLRALMAAIDRKGHPKVAVYAGRHATDVQEYLTRFYGIPAKEPILAPVTARQGLPDDDAWLRRQRRQNRAIVVLTGPDTKGLDAVRRLVPDALFLPGGPYAN